MSGIDAGVNTEIFRKDFPMVLDTNRHHATLLPARLAYDAGGYMAGQVLAMYTTGPSTGLYTKYVSGGASGSGTAVGVLFADLLDAPAATASLAQIIVKGELYQSKLIGLDSTAISDLKARSVTTASGVQILLI